MITQIDSSWTLFLDRDGVINIEKENDYIHHWSEFVFYPGVQQSIARLGRLFGKVIVVTNQKGIGKGVTLRENVEEIHHKMTAAIAEAGGYITAVYYCPDTDSSSPCRKPNAGMAHMAQKDFPGIDFARSLMVGNNVSDLQFGRNAGMHTAFVRTTRPEAVLPPGLASLEAADLNHLCNLLCTGIP